MDLLDFAGATDLYRRRRSESSKLEAATNAARALTAAPPARYSRRSKPALPGSRACSSSGQSNGLLILWGRFAQVVDFAVITSSVTAYGRNPYTAGTARTAGNRPSGCRDNRHLSKTTAYKTGAPLGTICRPHRTATSSGEHRGQVQPGERHVEWGRKPSGCQPDCRLRIGVSNQTTIGSKILWAQCVVSTTIGSSVRQSFLRGDPRKPTELSEE